jgi:hypothetical protein
VFNFLLSLYLRLLCNKTTWHKVSKIGP